MGSMERALRRGQAERLNRLVNHPDVAQHLAPLYSNLDVSGFFKRPENICIFKGHGAMLFGAIPAEATGRAGWYDVHYIFPRHKGPENLEAARACVHEMFAKHGARVLCGNTPRDNRAARLINRALGSVPMGEGIDSQGRPCIFYVLERATWATLSGASSGASAPL